MRVGAANWAWLNPGWPPGGRSFKGGSQKSSLHRRMWHKEILTTAWPGGWKSPLAEQTSQVQGGWSCLGSHAVWASDRPESAAGFRDFGRVTQK